MTKILVNERPKFWSLIYQNFGNRSPATLVIEFFRVSILNIDYQNFGR